MLGASVILCHNFYCRSGNFRCKFSVVGLNHKNESHKNFLVTYYTDTVSSTCTHSDTHYKPAARL